MKHQKRILLLLSAIAMVCATVGAQGQVVIGGEQQYDIDYLTPKQYEIGGITIENADRLDHRMVLMVAGLQVGDKVAIPGDKISTAIDNLWKQGLFEDVKIVVTRIQGDKVFLKIVLRERPKLLKFAIKGVKGDDAKKLRDDMNIATGDVVTENMLQTTTNIIRSYYLEKGFSNVEVNTTTTPDTTDGKDNQVVVTYNVHRGKRVKIDSLILEGNTQVPTNKILRKMKKTHDVHYAKKLFFWTSGFWKRSKYRDADFQEDLDNIITLYNELGYRDARIISDTNYMVAPEQLGKKTKQDRMKVKIKVHEGEKFYFRDIAFAGNTVYPSELLARHLRINKGDPYNKTTLETNLTYNPSGTDITSLYMDNGYLFFRATPVETAVENDSIDIEIRIVEGKQARIRNVMVEGNTVTNDRIIMRELHTRPGDLFSRDAVIRSRRELVTLNYFKEETLIPEPKPNPEDGTVDILYKVEENSTSQLQLQGGYGSGMIIGQVGIQLNNFSARNIFNKKAWNPLPAGDGQKLGLNFTTNGTYYYAGNISFTEPWLGGRRPQSLSVSLYDNFYSNGYLYDKDDAKYYSMMILGAGVSLGKRLKWPDDYFTLSHGITYKHYILNNYSLLNNLFTNGTSNDISYGLTIGRNSYDSPIYTRSGSEFSISGYVTPPYSLLNGKDYSSATNEEKYKWLEYYKINLRGSWMLNLVGDVVLNARFRFGYMGYFNDDIGLAPFGRYYLGGDGLSTWVLDGREVIPLRGYQNNSLNPDGGAAVFDRFTMELHQPIIESASATIWVLGFMEGGNSWSSIKEFQPFRMYNSAGLGVRLFMPMFGLIGIDWGYGFDGNNGGSQFHFSIGQSID
jgi:outer membrane protein insertion porin family